jgi:thioredoxin-related protein
MITHGIARRTALQHLILTLGFQSGLSYAQATSSNLVKVVSLRESAQLALRQGRPLVLMVGLRGCPWCDFVRASHLAPLIREQGIVVVELDMGNSGPEVRDFAGAMSSHKVLAQRWGVKRAPTVLFLDAAGEEVAPRLVGVSSQDYYGVYLEQRLDAAREHISSKERRSQ